MPGHRLTISIGVAERKSTGDTVADWIARADNALYKAKSFRKNRVELYTSVYDRFDHLDQVNDDERIISIKTLLSVIDARDRYTRNHTEHVVEFCETFARFAKLSDEESQKLISSAYLHDIGKINISKETLITEKRLTDKQWEEIRKHPADGADIVRKMKDSDEIADIVLQHHEKFDGTGYPNHVAGKDLHKLARILTLADSFDAMTTKRNYQRARTYEEAFEEIRRCAGTQFDPELSEIFIRAINETYR
jgi:putative nucleotidyltransferase with HDIG domain